MGAPSVLETVVEPDRIGKDDLLQEPWLGTKRLTEGSRKNKAGLYRQGQVYPFCPQDDMEGILGNSPSIMGNAMEGGGWGGSGHSGKISNPEEGWEE